MTCLIIVVKDADVFDALAAAGVEVKRLKRIINTAIVWGDPYFIVDFPGVISAEIDQKNQSPVDEASIVFSDMSGGPWALARICRRTPPWNVHHIVHPISTFYRHQVDGTGVDIYFCDSGIDTSHIEFEGRATNVFEYVSSGGAGDDNGHGTLTAAAAGGATLGCAKGSLLWSFKSANVSASNTDSALIVCIDEILDHYESRSGTGRPAVCNLSIHPSHSATVRSGISAMIDAGITCVVSAGNDMVNVDSYALLSDPDILVVGGLNIADLPYWVQIDGTNFGNRVDILAPAQGLKVAAAAVRGKGEYEVRRGTSIAAPYVSGVAACMLQGHSRLTSRYQVQALREYLLAEATVGRKRDDYGLSPLPDRIVYLDPTKTFHSYS